MAHHDYTIANQGFPATRSDLNNVLQAIATNNTGTSAPSTLYAGQFWIDTTATTWVLYIHDGTDNIQFAQIDTSANTVNFIDSALANDVVINTSGAITTTGAFTSVGIDDNATSTAMTIDSSEKVGIGTTSPSTTLDVVGTGVNGIELGEQSDGNDSSRLFFTNSTNVCAIRSSGGSLKFSTGATINSSSGDDRVIIHSNGVMSATNGIALGVGANNTSSNVLDDYEEGLHTVTATDSGGGATITMNTSFDQLAYTKIGRLVHIQGVLLFASISGSFSGSLTISLPFTSSNETDQGGRTIMGVGTHNVDFTSGTQIYLSIGESSSTATLTTQGDNIGGGNGQPQGSGQLYIGGTYIA